MTRLAFNLLVGALQSETCNIVIKGRRNPGSHLVAGTAVVREVGFLMIGIRGAEIISAVAGIAVSRCSGKLGCVARCTIQTNMTSLENRSGRVVKCRTVPGNCGRAVTLNTITAESREDMIRIRGRHKITLMTRLAIRWGTRILFTELPLMTRLAIGNSVDARERKPTRSVNFKHLLFVLPSARCMTALASRTKLAVMRISMAFGTLVGCL